MFHILPELFLYELRPYLPFLDKIICSKAIGFSFYRCIDKTKHSTITHVIHISTEEDQEEYMVDLCDEWIEEIADTYLFYQHKDHSELDHPFLSYQTIRRLRNLFFTTYFSMYTRKCIEYIEDHHDIPFFYTKQHTIVFSFEQGVHQLIHNIMIDEYNDTIQFGTLDLFCNHCGTFGHVATDRSIQCIFY